MTTSADNPTAPLFLYEISVSTTESAAVERILKHVDATIHRAGGELIEAQVTRGGQRVFVVTEFGAGAAPQLDATGLGDVTVTRPHAVRLVGAELDEVKAGRPAAGYLVEWDLPADLDMASYLDRKKANAPKYAEVPEVSFLRTYVREDMDKCLCLYDGPDEAAVRRARQAVDTPIDRLYGLENGRP